MVTEEDIIKSFYDLYIEPSKSHNPYEYRYIFDFYTDQNNVMHGRLIIHWLNDDIYEIDIPYTFKIK